MDRYRAFGLEIKRLRKERGLNQGDLASLVGLDQSYLSRIERGVYAPPSNTKILAIADALSADRQSLFALAGRTADDLIDTAGDQGIQFAAAAHTLQSLGVESLGAVIALAEFLMVMNRIIGGSHELSADRKDLTAAYHKFKEETYWLDNKMRSEIFHSVMSLVKHKTEISL